MAAVLFGRAPSSMVVPAATADLVTTAQKNGETRVSARLFRQKAPGKSVEWRSAWFDRTSNQRAKLSCQQISETQLDAKLDSVIAVYSL